MGSRPIQLSPLNFIYDAPRGCLTDYAGPYNLLKDQALDILQAKYLTPSASDKMILNSAGGRVRLKKNIGVVPLYSVLHSIDLLNFDLTDNLRGFSSLSREEQYLRGYLMQLAAISNDPLGDELGAVASFASSSGESGRLTRELRML